MMEDTDNDLSEDLLSDASQAPALVRLLRRVWLRIMVMLMLVLRAQ